MHTLPLAHKHLLLRCFCFCGDCHDEHGDYDDAVAFAPDVDARDVRAVRIGKTQLAHLYVCTTHIHEYELLLLLSACALNARQQQRIRISNACGDWDFCYVRFV